MGMAWEFIARTVVLGVSSCLLGACIEGDSPDEQGQAESVESSPVPSDRPSDASLTSNGYVNQRLGFGLGFNESWRATEGTAYLTPADVLVVAGGYSAGVPEGNLDLGGSDPEQDALLVLQKDDQMLNIATLPAALDDRQFGESAADAVALLEACVGRYFGMNWTEIESTRAVSLGGRSVARWDGRFVKGPRSARSAQILFITDGRAVYVTLTRQGGGDLAELESVLSTLTFY